MASPARKTVREIDEVASIVAAQSWASGPRSHHGHGPAGGGGWPASVMERVFPPLSTEFRNLSLIQRRETCFSIVPMSFGRPDPACDGLYSFLERFRLPASTMTIMAVKEPGPSAGHHHKGSGVQLPVWLRTPFLRLRHSVNIESADGFLRDVLMRLVFRHCNAPDPLDEGLVRLACLDPAATRFLSSIPWDGRGVSAHGVTEIPSWPIIYPASGPFPSLSSQTRGERPSHCRATITAFVSVVGVPRWWLVAEGHADPALDRTDPTPAPVLLAYGASIAFDELPHERRPVRALGTERSGLEMRVRAILHRDGGAITVRPRDGVWRRLHEAGVNGDS